MKKWVVLAAGIVLQLVLGGVYAWSEFTPSLVEEYGFTDGQSAMVFGLTIAVFTLSMVVAGRQLARFGPRLMGSIGAILFGAGYLVASQSGGNFYGVLLGIGVLTGAGIGAGYVCPLTVGMKWFPNNKGLVTGVAVGGFGGGAIVLTNLARYLLQTLNWDVFEVFRLVGFSFGGVALLGALLLSEPTGEETTEGTEAEAGQSIRTHLLSGTFLLLTFGIFAGTFAGLLTIGNLKRIITGSGLSGEVATWAISIFAVGNAAGRVVWGQAHDRLGSRKTVLLSLLVLAISLVPLLFNLPAPVALGTVLLIGAGFGACFVVYASSMVEHFGSHLFPRLYPICFLGYGLAGITGPPVAGWLKTATGSFVPGIGIGVGLVLLALAMLGTRLAGASPASIAE